MPIFNLPNSNEAIVAALTGVMLFPRAVAKRRMLATAYRVELGIHLLKAGIGKIENPELYEEHLKNHIPPHILIDQAAKEIGDHPTLAGAMLLLTLGTDRKVASLNLTKLALDNAYKSRKQTSKRKLEYLWKEYESVAHFWAAHQIWIDADNFQNTEILPGFPCHPLQVYLFLAIAEYLRRKGEQFQLPRTRVRETILNKNRTWKVRPAGRIPKMSDKDFLFDSKYKFIVPILNERKQYGLN
jgi:hypothetical protein